MFDKPTKSFALDPLLTAFLTRSRRVYVCLGLHRRPPEVKQRPLARLSVFFRVTCMSSCDACLGRFARSFATLRMTTEGCLLLYTAVPSEETVQASRGSLFDPRRPSMQLYPQKNSAAPVKRARFGVQGYYPCLVMLMRPPARIIRRWRGVRARRIFAVKPFVLLVTGITSAPSRTSC